MLFRSYMQEWKKLDLHFNGICSGFLGSKEQIEIVKKFFKEFKTEETQIIVDPVMGDYGKPYPTYTEEMCGEMKKLVEFADILTPNVTRYLMEVDGTTVIDIDKFAGRYYVDGEDMRAEINALI